MQNELVKTLLACYNLIIYSLLFERGFCMIQPLEKTSLNKLLIQQLTEAILTGKMIPGQKLPPEIELASSFHMSRNMLREALKTLEMLGIIESRHGRGTFISELAKQRIANIDVMNALASNQSVNSLLETRIVIEPGLAEFAAQRRTMEDIDVLWSTLNSIIRYDDEHTVSKNLFHLAVARTSKCMVLSSYLESVFKQLLYANYGELQEKMSKEQITRESEEHQAILECIIDHDGKGAKQRMYIHLINRYNMIQSFGNLQIQEKAIDV